MRHGADLAKLELRLQLSLCSGAARSTKTDQGTYYLVIRGRKSLDFKTNYYTSSCVTWLPDSTQNAIMPKAYVEDFGWTAVPRDRSNVPSKTTAKTVPVQLSFDEIWPTTGLVQRAQEYVKEVFPQETYNHSLRVYCYGHAMVSLHFQPWIAAAKEKFFETWALTCLFHDLATTPEHRGETHLSFEFHGGLMALERLQSFGAPRPQAESVAEAIIRHQDPGETGTISRMGQLIQMATEFGEAALCS